MGEMARKRSIQAFQSQPVGVHTDDLAESLNMVRRFVADRFPGGGVKSLGEVRPGDAGCSAAEASCGPCTAISRRRLAGHANKCSKMGCRSTALGERASFGQHRRHNVVRILCY